MVCAVCPARVVRSTHVRAHCVKLRRAVHNRTSLPTAFLLPPYTLSQRDWRCHGERPRSRCVDGEPERSRPGSGFWASSHYATGSNTMPLGVRRDPDDYTDLEYVVVLIFSCSFLAARSVCILLYAKHVPLAHCVHARMTSRRGRLGSGFWSSSQYATGSNTMPLGVRRDPDYCADDEYACCVLMCSVLLAVQSWGILHFLYVTRVHMVGLNFPYMLF